MQLTACCGQRRVRPLQSMRQHCGHLTGSAHLSLLCHGRTGVACAAIDTSAMAIVASLYKSSRWFGGIMGLVESTMSLGYFANRNLYKAEHLLRSFYKQLSTHILHTYLRCMLCVWRTRQPEMPEDGEMGTMQVWQVGGGPCGGRHAGPVRLWHPLLRHQPAGDRLHADRLAILAT